MKKIKSLSALIALIACTSIGGAYTAWTYAGTDDIADVLYESKVTITDTQLTGANGVFAITSNLVLEVDQRDDDHYAKLVFKSNDSNPVFLKIVFTPSLNAPDTVKKNAVDAELYFGLTTEMQYTMDQYGNYKQDGSLVKDIFVLNPVSNGQLDKNIDWTKQADGTFTYELNQAQLETMIKLNTFEVDVEGSTTGEKKTDTFRLDTKAEHDAFQSVLKGNIVARVTDGTVN